MSIPKNIIKPKMKYKEISKEEEIRIKERILLYDGYCPCEFCSSPAPDGLRLNARGVFFYICFRCSDIIFDQGKAIKVAFSKGDRDY